MASNERFAIQILFVIGIISSVVISCCCASNKRICGRELADTLKVICKNNYNGFGGLTEDSHIEHRSTYEYQSIPFLSKLTGGVLSPKVRRKRYGVSDECCRKPCTFKELSSYCTIPSY